MQFVGTAAALRIAGDEASDLRDPGEATKDAPVVTNGRTDAAIAFVPPNLYFSSRGNSQASASALRLRPIPRPLTDEKFNFV